MLLRAVHNLRMNPLMSLIAAVFRTIVRLSLFALASVFVLLLLGIGLAATMLTILWSLLTGRKPAVWTTFTRFQQASRQFRSGVWTGRPQDETAAPSGAARNADVVDVDFKEIPESPPKKLP